MNVSELQFGLDTFGDMSLDDQGRPVSAGQVIRDVVEQAKLAEEVGLNSFNIGEHHRDDYAVSAPDTILAGIATVTSKIKLGTGVTVLSSDDPVRVYQRFATIDALSNGRAEITAGRGSFIESFPLFGYELANYGDLFEEKLELLVELLKEKPVTWSGRMPCSAMSWAGSMRRSVWMSNSSTGGCTSSPPRSLDGELPGGRLHGR
jgi:alkanesulfonate monooxygenase SsuD/methylene tetrahydromethanopterin reductase-like flavin-dependent oxidoreductase (luciferase family)